MKGQEAVGGNPARERRSRAGRVLQGPPPPASYYYSACRTKPSAMVDCVIVYMYIYIRRQHRDGRVHDRVHSVCMQGQRCKRRPSSEGQGKERAGMPTCRGSPALVPHRTAGWLHNQYERARLATMSACNTKSGRSIRAQNTKRPNRSKPPGSTGSIRSNEALC